MTALAFPSSRMEPERDQTERAIHLVIEVVADFERAIATADTFTRLQQIQRRVRACVELLQQVQNTADTWGES